MDSWHQPWNLRRGSSNTITSGDPNASSRFDRPPVRRALSATGTPNIQPKCVLLSKVPGEIRNPIYRLILGDRYLGIYDCGGGSWRSRVRHLEISPGQMSFPDPLLFLPTNKLAILQTCRQVYVEAADLLYSTNRFQVLRMQDMKCFNKFMIFISPTRLATITSLTLVVNVDYFEPLHHLASYTFKHWKTLWALVCLRMTALRELSLHLRNLWAIENLKLTADTYWVKPFLSLRNLDNFELIVNREDIISPGDLQDHQGSRDAEQQLISKIDRLRQYSINLLCSPR